MIAASGFAGSDPDNSSKRHRRLLLLLLLSAPLVACGDPRRAPFEAAIQSCRNAYPMKVGAMVARTSCIFHQREHYGFIAPNERSVRSLAMTYATKVDRKRRVTLSLPFSESCPLSSNKR